MCQDLLCEIDSLDLCPKYRGGLAIELDKETAKKGPTKKLPSKEHPILGNDIVYGSVLLRCGLEMFCSVRKV